jgi:bacteriocin-like protein
MNNEIHHNHELSIDELDQVSGGGIIDIVIKAYEAVAGKNLIDAVHPPAPKMNMLMR